MAKNGCWEVHRKNLRDQRRLQGRNPWLESELLRVLPILSWVHQNMGPNLRRIQDLEGAESSLTVVDYSSITLRNDS